MPLNFIIINLSINVTETVSTRLLRCFAKQNRIAIKGNSSKNAEIVGKADDQFIRASPLCKATLRAARHGTLPARN